ncbi:MAG TPA: glycoside hydrolase family 25 protein [Ferruginibacter sp.]|nr:glycoside hydrolase family 25 protein [Ferruginibacter sp.]
MAARKKKAWGWRLGGIALLLMGAMALAYWLSHRYFRPSFVHYAQFGISIPTNYSIHGIDVSKHQQTIAWEEVQRMQANGVKIGFAFIKATEGIGRMDEQFRRNWYHARLNGIPRGAYHFFIASKSGKAQAENFLETVDLEPNDLPPVLDVEQTYGTDPMILRQRVHDWLTMVESRYGVKPIVYTNADFYARYLGEEFNEYPVWVAHYLVQDKPRINRPWHFWQHSETGHVNGIRPYVDFNVFNGDSVAFQKMLYKSTSAVRR